MQTPFPSSHINQTLYVRGVVSRISFLVSSVIIRSVELNVGAVGVEISAFPLTWHIALNNA